MDDMIQIQTIDQGTGSFPLMINFAGGLFLALRCKQTLEPCRAFSSGGDVFRCQGLSQLHITADSRQIQQKNIFHVRAGGKIDNRLNAKLGELTAERIPVALIEFAHIIGIIIGIVTEENGPAVCADGPKGIGWKTSWQSCEFG